MSEHGHNQEAHTSTMMWADHTHAPSVPTLLGHFNGAADTQRQPQQQLIHLHPPFSPIISYPPHKPTLSMNEKYSFQQMHDLDNTILLPLQLCILQLNMWMYHLIECTHNIHYHPHMTQTHHWHTQRSLLNTTRNSIVPHKIAKKLG